MLLQPPSPAAPGVPRLAPLAHGPQHPGTCGWTPYGALLWLRAPFPACQGKPRSTSPRPITWGPLAPWRVPPAPPQGPASSGSGSLGLPGRAGQAAGRAARADAPPCTTAPGAVWGAPAPCQGLRHPGTQHPRSQVPKRTPKGHPSSATSPLGAAAGPGGPWGAQQQTLSPIGQGEKPHAAPPSPRSRYSQPSPAPAGHWATPPPARC